MGRVAPPSGRLPSPYRAVPINPNACVRAFSDIQAGLACPRLANCVQNSSPSGCATEFGRCSQSVVLLRRFELAAGCRPRAPLFRHHRPARSGRSPSVQRLASRAIQANVGTDRSCMYGQRPKCLAETLAPHTLSFAQRLGGSRVGDVLHRTGTLQTRPCSDRRGRLEISRAARVLRRRIDDGGNFRGSAGWIRVWPRPIYTIYVFLRRLHYDRNPSTLKIARCPFRPKAAYLSRIGSDIEVGVAQVC